ncbi:hypothetical protein D9619_004754 [Psilocybe cf. subviscida]|uniref:Uncharacterized protein n=1 Tax=Psilocybe cf. subviscida TaxID=2480587 RepID=A0A8H5BR05_9AGAR|nr:hypothetical protein D9619_004754 [Psilocybe cf. subviscida]
MDLTDGMEYGNNDIDVDPWLQNLSNGYQVGTVVRSLQRWGVLLRLPMPHVHSPLYSVFNLMPKFPVLSILNIIFATSLRPALRVAVTLLERTLHSTLASRVTLHMRDQVAQRMQRGISSEHELHATRITFHRQKDESTFLPTS